MHPPPIKGKPADCLARARRYSGALEFCWHATRRAHGKKIRTGRMTAGFRGGNRWTGAIAMAAAMLAHGPATRAQQDYQLPSATPTPTPPPRAAGPVAEGAPPPTPVASPTGAQPAIVRPTPSAAPATSPSAAPGRRARPDARPTPPAPAPSLTPPRPLRQRWSRCRKPMHPPFRRPCRNPKPCHPKRRSSARRTAADRPVAGCGGSAAARWRSRRSRWPSGRDGGARPLPPRRVMNSRKPLCRKRPLRSLRQSTAPRQRHLLRPWPRAASC